MSEDATNLVADENASVPGVDDATAAEIDDQIDETGAEDGQTGEGEEGEDQAQVDDGEEFVEVEREGKKFKVPKALHGELLMQQDYTRKTQALAEQHRSFEQAREAFEQAQEAERTALIEDRAEIGKVASLQQQLEQWKAVDWDAIEQEDAQNGTNKTARALRQYNALKDELSDAEGVLKAKQDQRVAQRTLEQQRQSEAEKADDARLIQEGYAAMKRDFPDWSPEVGQKTMEFGFKIGGFTPQELNQVRDPRMIKILHLARLGQEAVTQKRAATNVQRAQATQPVPTVDAGRAAPAKGEPKDPDEWAKWRNKQIADKRRAGRR